MGPLEGNTGSLYVSSRMPRAVCRSARRSMYFFHGPKVPERRWTMVGAESVMLSQRMVGVVWESDEVSYESSGFDLD